MQRRGVLIRMVASITHVLWLELRGGRVATFGRACGGVAACPPRLFEASRTLLRAGTVVASCACGCSLDRVVAPPAGDSFGVLRVRGARGGEVEVTAELGGVEVVVLLRLELKR